MTLGVVIGSWIIGCVAAPSVGIFIGSSIGWRKDARDWRNIALKWQQVARLTAIIADELIETHDPDHDEVSAQAREQLRRVRGGVIA